MAFAIRDGYPVSPGHTLAIPNRHVGSFFDLSPQEHDALFEVVQEQKRVLDKEFSPHAFNIGINDGSAAAILSREDQAAWLAGSIDEARTALKAYPANVMDAYEVSIAVNTPKNNDPSNIVAVTTA